MNTKKFFGKKASVIAASITVFALLLTGTFAWFSGRISAENVFWGTKTETPPADVVLHDDFENPNKDVYVENISEEKTVYVRVKLNEVADFTTSTRPGSPMPEDTVWHAHIPGRAPEGHLDHREAADTDEFHDKFVWTWGAGEKKDYIKADGTEADGVYDDTAAAIAAMKGTTPSRVGETPMGDIVCADWYVGDGFVSLYSELFTTIASRADYIGWIYDADGWAYWSQPLKPGEVTSLLLSKVDTTAAVKSIEEWYYIIDVIMESVDAADLKAMWIDGGASVDPENTKESERAGTFGRQALTLIKDLP